MTYVSSDEATGVGIWRPLRSSTMRSTADRASGALYHQHLDEIRRSRCR